MGIPHPSPQSRAVVTGASSGIGHRLAERLAAGGARVAQRLAGGGGAGQVLRQAGAIAFALVELQRRQIVAQRCARGVGWRPFGQ